VGLVEVLDVAQHEVASVEGAGLVEADHVDPGQALDARPAPGSAPSGGRESALTVKAMLVSSTSPSGTIATRPATEACTAPISPRSDRILGADEEDRGRDHQPADVLDDPVDAVAQLGLHEREPSGVGAQLEGGG
jgi:hypothetical protein